MIELYNPQALKISIGDPTSVERTFARIEGVLGEVNVLLYNVGAGMFEDVETITPDQFGQAWRVNAYGALLSFHQSGLKNLLDIAVLKHVELEAGLKVQARFQKIDEMPFDFERKADVRRPGAR